METTLFDLCELNKQFNHRFKKLTKPVIDYFNVINLYLDHVTFKGDFWFLGYEQEIANYYFLVMDGLNNDMVLHDLDLISSNTMVWHKKNSSSEDEKGAALNLGLENLFNIDSGLIFVYPDDTGAHSLSFAGNEQNNDYINLLLKEKRSIEDFKCSLVTELSDIIAELEEKTFSLFSYISKENDETIHEKLKEKLKRKIKYLLETKQIEQEDIKLLNIKLTPREKQCAMFILKGCTLNVTAQHLNITVDAVSGYLGRIKGKCGVNRKPELLKVFGKLAKMEYFAGNILLEKIYQKNAKNHKKVMQS